MRHGRRSHRSWGHDPFTFRGKGGQGEHNLGIIHISHIALITRLHQCQRPVVFILAVVHYAVNCFATGGL